MKNKFDIIIIIVILCCLLRANVSTVAAASFNGSDAEVIHIERISLNKNAISIAAGETDTLKVKYVPENTTERDVIWSSSNPKCCEVDENGTITAKSLANKVVIKASTPDGVLAATCNVRVLFSDVTNPNLAAYDAIYWGTDKGIVAGYGSYFDIDAGCTRAQVVMFLWRAAGKPKPKGSELKFRDAAKIEKMAPDYKKAILWGNEKGIVMGFTAGENAGCFKPNDPCTRGQILTFLWRYGGQKPAKSGAVTFPDVPKTHKYYKAIMWASSYGIARGFHSPPERNGKFMPDIECTRGQCITFIYKMLN